MAGRTAVAAPPAQSHQEKPGAFFWLAMLGPWVIMLIGLGWAGTLRLTVRNDPYAWYWALAVIALDAVLVTFAFYASRPRGRLTCLHATVSFTLYAAWQWNAIATPDFTWRPLLAYGMGMVAVGVTSNMMTIWHKQGGGAESSFDLARKKIGEIRAFNEVHAKDGQVIARVEMEPGALLGKLDARALESFVDAPEGSARVIPEKGSARVGEVAIDAIDRLAEPQLYPGVGAQLNADLQKVPALLGVRTGGAPLDLYIAGDDRVGRNLGHVLMSGMNGAGKSIAYRFIVLDGMARGPAYAYVYGNARKADQERPWLLEGAERVARTKREVVDLLKWIRDEEIPRRAKILGEAGFDSWSTEAYRVTGLPHLDVILDEYAAVGPDIERLATDLGETCRSLGIRLLVGVQRSTGGRINTDFRAQFGTFLAFGCDNADSAAAALPEEVLDRGAMPQAWQNFHPGKCYLVAQHVPEAQHAEPGRTFSPNKKLMDEWGAALVAWRRGTGPAPVRREAVSVPDPSRESARKPSSGRAPVARHAPVSRHASAVEAVDDEAREGEVDISLDLDALDEDELLDEAGEALDEAGADEPPDSVDDETDDLYDPDDLPDAETLADLEGIAGTEPLDRDPPGGGMRLGLSPKMSDVEARELARRMLLALGAAGTVAFKVEEVLPDMMAATGFGASWFSKWLTIWSQDHPQYGPAILRRIDGARGRYEIIPPDRRAVAA